MRAVPYNEGEIKAYDRGFMTGARATYYEIKQIYDNCEYPEDLELEIEEYLEKYKNGRRLNHDNRH